jgi:hypothetical protein
LAARLVQQWRLGVALAVAVELETENKGSGKYLEDVELRMENIEREEPIGVDRRILHKDVS